MDREILYRYGIDYDKGLRRCMDDPGFYQKILLMFLQDDALARAKAAYAARDYKTLFGCMHELKGTSGNAALNELYEAAVPLVEYLRAGSAVEADIAGLLAAVEIAYAHTCEGISLAMEAN